jgi:hypothetical protein
MNSPNQQLLDEVNHAGLWFSAHKTKPLWAKEITSNQTVVTLEGEISASVGDYLCKGVSDDVWPQKAETLFQKYKATEDIDHEGWQKFIPKPETAGVLAVQIHHSFQVITSWGELKGQPGDYIVKNELDKNIAYPEDVWIVAKNIFEESYLIPKN